MTSIDDYDSGPDVAAEEAREEMAAERDTLRTLTETQARELAEARARLASAAAAFDAFEKAMYRAQRRYHNYQEWTDEETGPLDAARDLLIDALAGEKKT